MKRIALFALLAALCVLASCTRIRIGRLAGNTVVFPDSLEFFNGGTASFRQLEPGHPTAYKQLIIIDSLECSFCRVRKLDRYRDRFAEPLAEGACELVIILSPRREDVEDLRHFFLEYYTALPVYLDAQGDFLSRNPWIPVSPRYHSFVIDSLGHPVPTSRFF